MTKLIFGDRIGKSAALLVGCSAQIADPSGKKVLLTRRSDNGRWCLPGGRLDPGESIAETCAREVLEETRLEVQVDHLVGVYSSPHMLLAYNEQDQFQLISFHFSVTVTGGELGLSDETTEVGYFTPAEITRLDLMEHHEQRIVDGLAGRKEAFFR
jgi:ADP-ribose pyrophosphatase YjhB (NUDIX family)